MAQRSLVAVEEKDSVSDSYEDAHSEFGGVAIVAESQKSLSPQIINSHARLPGMKLHDLDRIEQVKESEASLDHRESQNYVEAYLATDEICTNDLFGSPKIQQPGESEDATDTQGDALETLSTEDRNQDPKPEISVSDEDGGECIAPESDEEAIDETLYQSPMKNSTMSKFRKVVVPEPSIPSDTAMQTYSRQSSSAKSREKSQVWRARLESVTSRVQQEVCITKGESWRTGTKVINSCVVQETTRP